MIGFNRLPENLSLTQNVILANKFIQCARPHPVGQRRLSLKQFFSLLLKKVILLFQLFLFYLDLNLYTLCPMRYALF